MLMSNVVRRNSKPRLLLPNKRGTMTPNFHYIEGGCLMNLERIQQALDAEKIDAWLFYDFRKLNPIAYQVLTLPTEDLYTRRWFYFIPVQGRPTALVSAVEPHVLHSLPGEQRVFRTWQEMHSFLYDLLQPGLRVAMEYSS